jgi:crossover junction endodeoxyribonuclease RuvC
MRVCGIDCGSEITGYGVVEWDDRASRPELVWLAAGGITPPKKTPLAQKLALIHAELAVLFERYQPKMVAVEEVFYSVNAKSAIKLGHVRGVALLAAAQAGLPIAEYAPLTIKSTVTGYGLAAKEQVGFMVARLLRLEKPPEPADAADALAIAICHIHHAQTLARQNPSLQEGRATWP